MARTPLQDALRAQPGNATPEAEYRGPTVAARFSNPQEELDALLRGCGIYDLGFRARLSLTGGDRVRWMNGMVTNNIRDLAPAHGLYAFLLNPQGRILGDMTVYNQDESLTVETDHSQIEKIVATFDHYIIMDDVEVTNISQQQTTLGVAGPKSRALLNAVGIEVPELQPLQMAQPRCNCDCGCIECTVVRGENIEQESYELWLAPKDLLKTWQALISAGATPEGSEALEMQRIAAGIPLYGVDIRERDLPQETEQLRALNFNKGCYVGQEIVERIRSRGNVHRKFTGFLAEGAAPITPGEKVTAGNSVGDQKQGQKEDQKEDQKDDQKEVGELTSVAVLPAPSGERTIALGYIRREVGVPGREVLIGKVKATVIQLPFDNVAARPVENAVLHRV
jgi:folate-binding protein YgfZ